MKITIELPDNTCAAFISYVADTRNGGIGLYNAAIGTIDLEKGYKDCTMRKEVDNG